MRSRAGAGRRLAQRWNGPVRRPIEHSSLRLPIATSVIAADIDADGDQDLLLGGPTGCASCATSARTAACRMQVQLVGLRTGSGKNNDFGIGAKVEVRAAELYQTRVITSRVTSFRSWSASQSGRDPRRMAERRPADRVFPRHATRMFSRTRCSKVHAHSCTRGTERISDS
jgi:hypothetical protein